jgi:hypothetical protein
MKRFLASAALLVVFTLQGYGGVGLERKFTGFAPGDTIQVTPGLGWQSPTYSQRTTIVDGCGSGWGGTSNLTASPPTVTVTIGPDGTFTQYVPPSGTTGSYENCYEQSNHAWTGWHSPSGKGSATQVRIKWAGYNQNPFPVKGPGGTQETAVSTWVIEGNVAPQVQQVQFSFSTSNWSHDQYYKDRGYTQRTIGYRVVENVGDSVFSGLSPAVYATGTTTTITRSDKYTEWAGRTFKVVSDIPGDNQVYFYGTIPAGNTDNPLIITGTFVGPFPKPPAASPTPVPLPSPSPTPMVTVTPYQATPSPSPLASATPYPDQTAMPTATVPANVVIDSTGQAAGKVYVSNAVDIYKPIVDALRGIGGGGGIDGNPGDGSGVGGDFDTGAGPLTQKEDDAKHNLSDKATRTQVSYDGTLKDGKEKLASIQPLNMPTVSGQKTSWGVSLPVLGALTIDISPYMTVIGIMRAVLLMVMLIGAWFASIKIIRSGIA